MVNSWPPVIQLIHPAAQTDYTAGKQNQSIEADKESPEQHAHLKDRLMQIYYMVVELTQYSTKHKQMHTQFLHTLPDPAYYREEKSSQV